MPHKIFRQEEVIWNEPYIKVCISGWHEGLHPIWNSLRTYLCCITRIWGKHYVRIGPGDHFLPSLNGAVSVLNSFILKITSFFNSGFMLNAQVHYFG